MKEKKSKEKIKREIPNYLLFDYEAVEEHLEKWRPKDGGLSLQEPMCGNIVRQNRQR